MRHIKGLSSFVILSFVIYLPCLGWSQPSQSSSSSSSSSFARTVTITAASIAASSVSNWASGLLSSSGNGDDDDDDSSGDSTLLLEEKTPTHFEDLPDDILLEIFPNLSLQDLFRLCRVSKRMEASVQSYIGRDNHPKLITQLSSYWGMLSNKILMSPKTIKELDTLYQTIINSEKITLPPEELALIEQGYPAFLTLHFKDDQFAWDILKAKFSNKFKYSKNLAILLGITNWKAQLSNAHQAILELLDEILRKNLEPINALHQLHCEPTAASHQITAILYHIQSPLVFLLLLGKLSSEEKTNFISLQHGTSNYTPFQHALIHNNIVAMQAMLDELSPDQIFNVLEAKTYGTQENALHLIASTKTAQKKSAKFLKEIMQLLSSKLDKTQMLILLNQRNAAGFRPIDTATHKKNTVFIDEL